MMHVIKIRTDEYLIEAQGSTSQEARDQFQDAVAASALAHIQRRDPPVADFVALPLDGAEPLTVNFTDLSTGSIATWVWDFGDGQTSTLQNPVHVYNPAVPGNTERFTVTLIITGAGGSAFETKVRYIKVN